MANPPLRIISDWEVRHKFNSGGFVRRWKQGRLYDEVLSEHIPASPLAGEPVGTKSQRVALVARPSGRKVAEFHWYLRETLEVGLSGDPDPKGVLDDGVWYVGEFQD